MHIADGWIIYPDCDVEVLPGKVYTVEDRAGVVRVGVPKSPGQYAKGLYLYGFLPRLLS